MDRRLHRTYETELPEGYVPVKTVAAQDRKFMIASNIAAVAVMAGVLIICFAALGPAIPTTLEWLAVVVLLVVYLLLHELTHGLVYKLATGQKLTFGISLTVAWCGVKDIYVYRRASLCAVSAPFVVYSIAFIAGMIFCPSGSWKHIFAWLMAFHAGGCVGDLYNILLYLFRLRDNSVLMSDTGPTQVFYAKKPE